MMPNWMLADYPPQKPRVFLSMPFGADGPHLQRFFDEYMRKDYYADMLNSCRFGPEVWEMVRERGLKIVKPMPVYGQAPE